jgi:Ca2+-binding RTX toxin-like protein
MNVINGTSAQDNLTGTSAIDLISAGSGNDLISGSTGNDTIDGGAGVDTLTGGEGSDQFLLAHNGDGLAPDSITDFVSGSDLLVIDLASLGIRLDSLELASSGLVSAESFVKGAGGPALDSNDYFLLDTAQGVLFFDCDGDGDEPAVALAKFVGVIDPAFAGSDIYMAL